MGKGGISNIFFFLEKQLYKNRDVEGKEEMDMGFPNGRSVFVSFQSSGCDGVWVLDVKVGN